MAGIQLGGLASGLDTNSMITQLLQVEAQPKVKMAQKQSVEQIRQQALKDIQTRLTNLSTAIESLGDSSVWGDVQTVESGDSTKVAATRTGAYSIGVTQLARANQWTQTGGATSVAANDTLHLAVGTDPAVDISLKAGDTLQTVADRINGTSDIKAYASVVAGKLVLSAKATGTDGAIASVTTDGGSGLGFAETQTAKSATFTIDGTSYTRQSNTVDDAMAGVTLTLKGDTVTSGAVTVTVGSPAADTGAITSRVQDFVNQYNSTIDFIRGKLTEQRVANPQTEADRAKGVLNGDSGLTSLLGDLRQGVGDIVSGRPGDMAYLNQLGLSTGATTGGGALNPDAVAGKLSLDSSKLSDALGTRLNDVKALFTDKTGVYSTEGLSQRLDGFVQPWLTSTDGKSTPILDGRIASSQSIIDELTREMSDFDLRLHSREQQLRTQFTAMETALAQVQSQGSQLSSQLSKLL